jgi:Fe-S oxidoreductase
MMEARLLDPSTQFMHQIMETIPDGERIKLCLQCGACSGACPFGFVMTYPPHGMIAAMRAGLIEDVLAADTAWMCVSCYACTQVCPAKIPVTVGLTTHVKEEMLLAGNVPTELQDALEKAQRYFNPLGESPRKRAEWAEGLDPEVPILAKTKQPVDFLWFVGDYASYHPSVRKATRDFARILQALEVDFAILGPEELSDGDSVRLAGEIGLFEMLAEKNGAAFSKYEFGEIITTDPHAYNALKNEYPRLDITYPVRHFTEFLLDYEDKLKELIKNDIKATVSYHDPCYLGRANGVYDAPRKLLGLIPGIELVEMSHSHENSLCCGGGGGGMWLDGFRWEKAKAHISEWRMREAVHALGKVSLEDSADAPQHRRILAVACPYEPSRFIDAAKTVPGAEGLQVKEITELLAEAMGVEE